MLKNEEELNKCKDRLNKTQLYISKNEKLTSLGSLVAGFTHDLSTPVGLGITGISNFIEQTNKINRLYTNGTMTQENFENYINKSLKIANLVFSNFQFASELMLSFKTISVDQTSELKRKFNLYEYFNAVVLSLHNKLKNKNIEINNSISKDININSYSGIYAQIFINLIINSIIHAFDVNKKATIDIYAKVENSSIILEYKDNGKGMLEKDLQQIFQPFFTTKINDGGSGLGTNIIYDLVTKNLSGEISVHSTEGEGLHYKMILPLDIS